MDAYHYSVLTESITNDLLILSKERQHNSNIKIMSHVHEEQMPDSWADRIPLVQCMYVYIYIYKEIDKKSNHSLSAMTKN